MSFLDSSVNINSDVNKKEFIEGYICPKSSEEALVGVVKHIKGTGQSSFTWTGPYGAGKSSLVLLFSSILSQDNVLREMALSRLSDSAISQISEFFNTPTNYVIPIVGEPSNPLFIIGQSLVNHGLCKTMPKDGQSLVYIIRKKADTDGRVVLVIDEMGKFLESSSNGQSESDIYLFQQLAELANSSSGKVILIGILHQSFNEYARNLSKLARDEWSKIQGRFVDYHINADGEEQLELVSESNYIGS